METVSKKRTINLYSDENGIFSAKCEDMATRQDNRLQNDPELVDILNRVKNGETVITAIKKVVPPNRWYLWFPENI